MSSLYIPGLQPESCNNYQPTPFKSQTNSPHQLSMHITTVKSRYHASFLSGTKFNVTYNKTLSK